MRKILCYLLLIFLATSCITKKELVYMQNEKLKKNTPTNFTTPYKEYELQPNDVLSIKVLSVQPETSNLFNIVDPSNAFGITGPSSLFLSGYSIDQQGRVTLPIIGQLKVSGLTVAQAQEQIQRSLDRYINDATVVTKLISFKISVLGDVRNPGYYYVYNEQASLLEALSMAGDLTQGASRENIKLIRQKPGGTEVVLLDLKDPNLVQSQYYYLKPNDVLYVEPRKTQIKRDNLVIVSTVLGVLSTAALILNFVNIQ
ncbi:polysaccharide export outer membrane protein [Pontibacter aydingkolensis]|uniref:Polysaccharide export protein n=1 Tax=Pontibacter aydingkolensis TaxID=1911536 RepID=A0ABS7CS97_9BACT|nr:polysaccharide biosynthesis/export family protein [Pontibacter aydingkolensis]MBW7466716.1 polysaccharide export protein [Pontibacter aydingkolensis]